MTYALAIFLIVLLAALVWLGYNAIINHREVQRLKRNGYRRVAARRYRRGHACTEMLRGIAELGVLVLLLAVVIGWMFYR